MGYFETKKIELKRILNDSFEKEVVAFLNSHDGTIYIGIDDDGTIVGVNNVDKLLKEISDVITDKILPDCKKFVHPSAIYEDGKMIIKVDVNKGNSLYYIKKFGRSASGCYVRIGTTCKSMSEEEIEKGYIKTLKIEEKSIIDKRCVRQKLSFSALKTLLISKGQHINDDTFDGTYSLLNKEGEYNYYAGLLEDNADVSIKVATFKGKDKTTFLKRQEFGFQCLVVAMKNVISYVDSINETYIDTSVRPRREKRMFSQEAFIEAWTNAVVHNDWKQGVPPAVYVYDDRLEIVSIGGLPKGQTTESFFKGKSVPVNEPMIRLFMKLDLMEQNGHGIPIILKEYDKTIFEIEDNFITVTIPFDKTGFENDAQNENVNESVNESVNLNDSEITILNIIKNNPKILRKEIFEIAGISRSTGDRTLKKLKELGVLERVGSDKSGCWKIKE